MSDQPDELVEYPGVLALSAQAYKVWVLAWNKRVVCPTCGKTSQYWCAPRAPNGKHEPSMHSSRLALAALLVE